MNDNEETRNLNLEKIKIENKNNNDVSISILSMNNRNISESNIKIRYEIWDNYKGILIFLVVFAHCLIGYSRKYKNSIINDIFIFIYIFHMPSFIFCSGFFSKSKNSKSKKSISKLFIQYYIFDSFMMIYSYLRVREIINLFNPNYSHWYLISLSFWRMIIPFLENESFLIIKSFFIALITGYSPDFCTNLFSIKRTFAFFPFFILGYWFKKEDFKRIINLTQTLIIKVIIIILFILFSSILFLSIKIKKISFSENDVLMEAYNDNNRVLTRMTLFIIDLPMIFLLLFSLPNRNIPVLTMIGRNSLYIYLYHRIFTIFLIQYLGCEIKFFLFIIYCFIATIIIVIVFGNNYFNEKMSQFIEFIYINMSLNNKKGKFIKFLFILLLTLIIMIRPIDKYFYKDKKNIL